MFKDGMICVWDIGYPSPPKYKEARHTILVKVEYEGTNKDLYSMAWVGGAGAGWVLVGTQQGLAGWKVVTDKLKEEKFPKSKPKMVEFRCRHF